MTNVAEYKGKSIILTSQGAFRVVGEDIEAPSLAALKKKIDKAFSITPVTLISGQSYGFLLGVVTIIGPAKHQRASWRKDEWPTASGRVDTGPFYEMDEPLILEMKAMRDRQHEEEKALEQRHTAEQISLTDRLVPVTSEALISRLMGTGK